MTPEAYQRLKAVFEGAIAADPEQRVAVLEQVREADPELGRELEKLLAAWQAGTGSLDAPLIRLGEVFPADHATAASFSEGELVGGRFRIVRLVGSGGMGEVYEADDIQLGQVALKTIRPDLAGRQHILRRFRQEVQLARKVSSINVCRIHELFLIPAGEGSGAAAFLTMEFLKGITLAERIERDGPLPLSEAESVALQMCAGLQAIHEAGIIHRDIKGRNVMLTPRNGVEQAVIMDLGLAREAEITPEAETQFTAPGAVMGTPDYMAPEQFRAGEVTAATDVYALGVVLYEVATGRHPFKGVKAGGRPAPVSSLRKDVPKHWDSVIARCLEYEPEKRYQSAREVAEGLQSRRAPSIAVPSHLRGLAAAVLAGILCVAGGLYWYLDRPYTASPDAQHWYDQGVNAIRDGTYLRATQALERSVTLDKNFVLAHARLADAWTELDFTGKAQDQLLRATALDAKRLREIDRHYLEAVRLTVTHEFAGAVKEYESILRDLPANEKAYGYVDLGRAQEKAANIVEAQKDYHQAAKLAPEYPASFVRLGVLNSRQERVADGEQAFARAEALYRAASNVEGIAEVEYQRGYAATLRGDNKGAIAFLESSLHAARDIPSPQLEIRAYTRMSIAEGRQGHFDRSIDLANQAVQLAQDRGLEYWATDGLIRLGTAYLSQRDYTKAEPPFQRALRLAHEGKRALPEANAELSLASVRSQQGKPDEAALLAQSALNYFKTAGYFTESTSALILIVRAERDKADFQKALPHAMEAVNLVAKAGNPVMLVQVNELAGSVLLRLERYPEALTYFQRALESGTKINQFVDYETLNCAEVLWRLGRYHEAAAMLASLPANSKANANIAIETARVQAGIALSRKSPAGALDIVRGVLTSVADLSPDRRAEFELIEGLAQLNGGQAKRASQTCGEALAGAEARANPELIARFRLCEAAVHLVTGRPQESIPLADSAHQFFAGSGEGESEWLSLVDLALCHKAAGNLEVSRQFASKALDILHGFEHNWGTSTYQLYLRRPDIEAEFKDLMAVTKH